MVAGPLGQYRQLRQTPAPSLVGVDTGPPHEGDTGQGVVLHTTLGPIKAILHQSATSGVRAVLWAWGARGGYAGPAEGVFAQLAEEFSAQGLTSLRLHDRHPGVSIESVLDVRAGLEFLKGARLRARRPRGPLLRRCGGHCRRHPHRPGRRRGRALRAWRTWGAASL